MIPIYRIYDIQEKRHRDDMIVWVNWNVHFLTRFITDEERPNFIVERCSWLYDKNKVLIYENDIMEYEYRDAIGKIRVWKWIVKLNEVEAWYLVESKYHWVPLDDSYNEVIGHALRDEHLLSDK